MMQEQQPTQFYDKLLHYLNRAYSTNIRTQELYIDLKKNTRKLRFNSIKNIYHTLTEGKADEVIFSKEKSSLIKNSSFNQKFTERTCWRLIEKLINKIAYYLMNEKKLDCLAPSILKSLHFTRNAPEKVTHKAAFVQFFSEVIDTLIAENNLLEQKIYQLLIERGYIFSVDQFYRMSRFEGPDADFTYSSPQGEDNDGFYNHQKTPPARKEQVKTNERANITRTKKRMLSIRKFVHTRNKSRYQSFHQKVGDQGLPKIEQNIDEAQSQAASEDQSDSQFRDNQKYNKMVHNIHNQVEKIVDQIMNHKDFEQMLANADYSGNTLFKSDEKTSKEPILRQVLKNMKIKNFKANEKLITMNNGQRGEPSRKNSKLKENRQVKIGRVQNIKNEKKRASIATAISSRLKQKVMLNSGIQQIKQLIVRNLGNLQNKYDENQEIERKSQRKNKRLQTQLLENNVEQCTTKDFKRRSSNLNFLKSAFVFNSESRSRINPPESRNRRYADLLNQSSVSSGSSQSTLNIIEPQKVKKKSNQNQKKVQFLEKKKKVLFTNEKIATMSKQGPGNRCGVVVDSKEFKKSRKNNFNTNLLQLAAKKYHRYQTEQSKKKKFQELFYNFQAQITQKNTNLFQEEITLPKKQRNPYMHHRKYQTFDRLQRRIF